MAERTLKIAISGTSYGYDKEYSYRTGERFCESCKAGERVIVPFGNGNRKRIGLILSIEDSEDKKLKPVLSVLDENPLIDNEMLQMIVWLKETTLCTYFEAFKTIIPSGLAINIKERYEITELLPEELSVIEQAVYDKIKSCRNQKDFEAVSEDKESEKILKELEQKGYIEKVCDFKRKVKDETIKMMRLTESYYLNPRNFKITDKQKKVTEFLLQNESASVKEIAYYCNVTSAVMTNLCKKGILYEFEYEEIPTSDAEIKESLNDIILSNEQQKAYGGIKKLIDDRKPSGTLLYGVTGSGKTSIFIKLIEHTLNIGRQALMLIPEISLTPQTENKFKSLFGDTVAVIHSNLSLSQRLKEYKRVKQGLAKIVVGTRSAVFAPLNDIGLIIMDEEGERSYKSESSPRYNARDIARKRCATHGGILLMASATPSVESFYNAKIGRYKLFELKERYGNMPLPDVTIVDMAEEISNANRGLFSDILIDEINYNLEHNEQTVLLLNRRGYYTYISCAECRQPMVCPNCNIPLTYHKANNQLICHYCSYSEEMSEKCPSCGSTYLKQTGVGTQKIEGELKNNFPEARILRMDTDSTYSRYAYEKNFREFGDGKYDIMVGTQMIAKGLNFPNVTLVGVLSVDKALYAGDFRSYERTFSLITQVVGRSGRGEKCGRAYLQTYVPDHYVLKLASEQDYDTFYEEEISVRKSLIFPPFCDICTIYFTSLVDRDARNGATIFVQLMKKRLESEEVRFPLRVLGPSQCSIVKVNGRYRYRIILKIKNSREFRNFIGEIYSSTFRYKEYSNVTVAVDINGDIL